MANISEQYIDFLLAKASLELPINVRVKAKQCLIDFIATSANGYYHNSSFSDCYPLEGRSSIIGSRGLYASAPVAAFLNGFNSHSTELDDGHRYGMTHIGAVVVSSVLSVVQERGCSFESLIKGIVMGYEATARLAQAVQPDHKKRGFHTTGTCGTIGAAIGCAFALGYNRDQMLSTLSAAATSASGFLEIQEDSSDLKPYNVSNASMSAVMACYVGLSGKRGAADILGGKRGFLQLYCNTVDLIKLVGAIEDYEIQRIYVKLYAACRHCHSAIEAAIAIRNQQHLSLRDIESITIDTYQLAILGHDHKNISGEQSAKLSIPFSVAVAYKYGMVSFNSFTKEVLEDSEIVDLISKVTITENPDYTSCQTSKRQATVRILFRDGKELSHTVEFAKGDRENPLTEEEFMQKLLMLTENTGIVAEPVIKAIEDESIQQLIKNLN